MHSHIAYQSGLAQFLKGDRGGSTRLDALTAELHPNQASETAAGLAADGRSALFDGSWFLQFQPSNPNMNAAIRGPMRIEGTGPNPRISGDIYVEPIGGAGTGSPVIEAMPAGSLVIGENWYPAFPQDQYAWYFRSLETTLENGTLVVQFERNVWDPALNAFVQSDMGGLRLEMQPDPVTWPNTPKAAPILRGQAFIGGDTIQVLATKTSDFYRGCVVEVDVMENRRWPDNATDALGTRTFTFDQVFRDAGMDFITSLSKVNIPEEAGLNPVELNTLLATHREPTSMPDAWRLWLLVGSSWEANPGVFGIMFDLTAPHREGSVGFYDPRMPAIQQIEASARGEKLGDVDLAFLRTLIHEAGHAFNLYHPKADDHGVQTGTTIMNQTGDVIGFATSANPYPGNASMAFNEHNRTALIHSPDPQTKPGWLRFGWGHDSQHSLGLAEPTGVMGLNEGTIPIADMTLKLDVPNEIHRGEIVVANLRLENASGSAMEVSSALNLAEDDLDIIIVDPHGKKRRPRDVVKICGQRDMVELAPGGAIENAVQLFFNNGDFTFSELGEYRVWARFRPSRNRRLVVESEQYSIAVRNSVTRKEQELETLMLDAPVGLSVAFGDFGADKAAESALEKVVKGYKDTDTGAVCAMVMSNTLARDHRDVRSGKVYRSANKRAAESSLNSALEGRNAKKAAALAMATVTPRYAQAPLIDLLQQRMTAKGGKSYSAGDRDGALEMMRAVKMLS